MDTIDGSGFKRGPPSIHRIPHQTYGRALNRIKPPIQK